ncbi:hypothetical protein IQ235_09620 [Oscillatoriales cyanobacterium LEGE 11467]|uniref:MotA/TolQ/ExbB proton channel domain-containing protein n=1 Tax=Zarconia navalis LEGE 11467 TaxID=1828826 RepID=A0A928VVK2_9CYAN|nr:hypothetical protein [Zarconia navalis]MBE9041037.1 hypothetical protein [Zarconia navalis LEGE 11467]
MEEAIAIQAVDTLFIVLILAVAIAAWIAEFRSIRHYQTRRYRTTAEAIDFLRSHSPTQPISVSALSKTVSRWLLHHLDGTLAADEFHPRIEGDRFVCLTSPNILVQPIPRSPVAFAPTLLTALGVLGTFTGIYLGLQGVDIGAIADPDTLLAKSLALLGGMKIAFVTSLYGLATASLSILGLAVGERIRQNCRDRLRDRFDRIATLATPGRLLSRLDRSDRPGGVSQINPEAIGEAIGRSLYPQFDRLVAELTQIRAERGKIEGIYPQFQPSLASISGELQQIREGQTSQDSRLENLVTQMRLELIEPVVERLDESAALTREASQSVSQLRSSLGEISASLAQSIQTIQNFQTETLVQLQDFAENLKNILDGFRQDTGEVMQEVSTQMNRAVDESIAGMEAQRSAFEASADRVAGAFLQQTETLKTVGREASNLMENTRESLLETLQNVDNLLQKTRQTVQEELATFRIEYQQELQQFFEEQNNLLDGTLNQQREGLSGVADKLQTVFREDAPKLGDRILESMANIDRTAIVVMELANTTGLQSGERLAQLQQLAETVGGEADRIDAAYTNLVDRLNQGLQMGNEQLSNYLQQANETYTQSIENVDRSAAEVCQQLHSTSQGLMDVASYLVAAAEDLRDSSQ